MGLNAAEVLYLIRPGWSAPGYELFRGYPAPMLDMAIQERHVAALSVAVSRQVDPHVAPWTALVVDAEGRIDDGVFVGVDEGEDLVVWDTAQLGKFLVRSRLEGTVEPDAEVETARLRDGGAGHGGFVGRTSVNPL